MIKNTKRESLNTLAERVKLSTSNRGDWSTSPEWGKRYQELLALPLDATEEQYLAIVDRYWIENVCGECGSDVEVTISLGNDALYDRGEVKVCLDCLGKAMEMAR